MLTPQAVTVEASARDDLHPSRALVARGHARARAGLVRDALDDLDRALGPRTEISGVDLATALATSVECRLARGELSTAMARADQLVPLLDAAGLVGATAHFGRGELAAATGDAEIAAGHFVRAGRLLVDDDPDLLPWRPAAALAEVRIGRRAQGAALARAHLAAARLAEAPYAVGLGLRALAIVDPRGDGIELLREARAVVSDLPALRLTAQIETDLAGGLMLTGGASDQDEALTLLRGAEEYVGREELWPLQGRIRRLLDRLGQPARPAPGEVMATLTVSERRIARLAAAGLTNREIASQLVVTVKAVEWHLSHVYRKLGIRSRTGLAGSLGL
ncbi:LuxR C-terminal-related transcriptional regulator [Nocardioides sp. SR21]|uniref:LuxR family transcriptional regulator n=1 Tax=Nocardioides sp. SR21 TaxID=2919501 RepID=UPI001FAA2A78|nr:LuxR C-terminal-related transcriptional regulator [Nocardioides sp. SR21]